LWRAPNGNLLFFDQFIFDGLTRAALPLFAVLIMARKAKAPGNHAGAF